MPPRFSCLTAVQDEEWDEEEGLVQGFKPDEFAFLSEMLGPKGVAFDNDDYLDDNDDEDLKNDSISQMDMQVRIALSSSFPLSFVPKFPN
jgi:hypothetical protein